MSQRHLQFPAPRAPTLKPYTTPNSPSPIRRAELLIPRHPAAAFDIHPSARLAAPSGAGVDQLTAIVGRTTITTSSSVKNLPPVDRIPLPTRTVASPLGDHSSLDWEPKHRKIYGKEMAMRWIPLHNFSAPPEVPASVLADFLSGDVLRCGSTTQEMQFWMWYDGAWIPIKRGHKCPLDGCRGYVLSISKRFLPSWVRQISYDTETVRANRLKAV